MTSRNAGSWTEGRYRAFITSVLRSGFRRWPPKYKALNAACVGVLKNKKTKRDGKHYTCALCSKVHPSSNVQVDHILPVVAPEGFDTWGTYIERLFCEQDNLQVVCKPCHKKKSASERKARGK
jgi:5-methylcytosine-specific restriction endonuclease McrA